MSLFEELREYTAMKYMGDCKCGKCQLVPRELIDRVYNALRRDDERGNYEDRHPNDMVPHPLTEIREWDEALAVLGIQDSNQTPADAIRELNAEIERLRSPSVSRPNHKAT